MGAFNDALNEYIEAAALDIKDMMRVYSLDRWEILYPPGVEMTGLHSLLHGTGSTRVWHHLYGWLPVPNV